MESGGQHELRRSQKIQDLAGNVIRERSFVKHHHSTQHQHHHHQHAQTSQQHPSKKRYSYIQQQQQQQQHLQNQQSIAANAAQIKGKPTLEIYRPPNVRTDLTEPNPRLNVHAKEFTMRTMQNMEMLQQGARPGVLMGMAGQVGLQHSRSGGNMLRIHGGMAGALPGAVPGPPGPPGPPGHMAAVGTVPLVQMAIPLLQSTSSGNMLQHQPRVHFQAAALQSAVNQRQPAASAPRSQLKRSKSMGSADSQSLATRLRGLALQGDAPDLGTFPAEVQADLQTSMSDPNKLTARSLMELARHVMERVVEGRRYSVPGAKLCVTVIERERTETFVESLLNICQQWYQERDRVLRRVSAADGSRFTAFMWFLTEMSCQLKRHRLQLVQRDGALAGHAFLALLVKCCRACVRPPIESLAEVECLFFVLTSIGRDLETELPAQLDQLLAAVRDAFLASAALPAVRKTLLQLIELKASNWQLSGPTVLYYYPKMK